jgi:hypothetical protein
MISCGVRSVIEQKRGDRGGTNLDDDVGDDRSQGHADEIFILLPPMRHIRRERQKLEPTLADQPTIFDAWKRNGLTEYATTSQ